MRILFNYIKQTVKSQASLSVAWLAPVFAIVLCICILVLIFYCRWRCKKDVVVVKAASQVKKKKYLKMIEKSVKMMKNDLK